LLDCVARYKLFIYVCMYIILDSKDLPPAAAADDDDNDDDDDASLIYIKGLL